MTIKNQRIFIDDEEKQITDTTNPKHGLEDKDYSAAWQTPNGACFFLHPMLLAGLYSCFTFIFIKFAQYIDVNKNHVRRMGDKTIKTSEL